MKFKKVNLNEMQSRMSSNLEDRINPYNKEIIEKSESDGLLFTEDDLSFTGDESFLGMDVGEIDGEEEMAIKQQQRDPTYRMYQQELFQEGGSKRGRKK